MTRDEQWLLNEKYGGEETADYEADKKRLASRTGTSEGTLGEPLAYIIGWQPFLGLKIYLDSKPLIPRPETEWWTEQLTNAIFGTLRGATARAGGTFSAENDSVPRNRIRELRFLDLCAGSGAIGCTALAKLSDAQVYFGEIDPAHETTIRKNIRENNLDAVRTTIRIGNLFEPFGDMRFDFIAANPPYIPAGRELPASVADYEPSLALFSGDDGLDVIRGIAAELPKHLTEDGVAWIECDSSHSETAQKLFAAQGFLAEIRTDQYDKPRILVVSFPQC